MKKPSPSIFFVQGETFPAIVRLIADILCISPRLSLRESRGPAVFFVRYNPFESVQSFTLSVPAALGTSPEGRGKGCSRRACSLSQAVRSFAG